MKAGGKSNSLTTNGELQTSPFTLLWSARELLEVLIILLRENLAERLKEPAWIRLDCWEVSAFFLKKKGQISCHKPHIS